MSTLDNRPDIIAEAYDLHPTTGEAMTAHPYHVQCAPDGATEAPGWGWDHATRCEGCGERLTDPPPAAAPPVIATRVTMHEAKRHFEAGGAVLVSEYGHEPTQTVHPDTTTHDRTRTTWDALAAMVKEWRNRYPNQRFYIVPGTVIPARLEYLRDQLRAECISMSELHELQGLADHIDRGDVELLEPAGVPEFPDDDDETERGDIDVDTLDEMTMAAAMVARVLAILEGDEGWSADTLDAIGNALIGSGYARTNDAGMFATTGRAERAAALIR